MQHFKHPEKAPLIPLVLALSKPKTQEQNFKELIQQCIDLFEQKLSREQDANLTLSCGITVYIRNLPFSGLRHLLCESKDAALSEFCPATVWRSLHDSQIVTKDSLPSSMNLVHLEYYFHYGKLHTCCVRTEGSTGVMNQVGHWKGP